MGKDVVLQLLSDFRTDGAIYDSFEFGGDGLKNLSVAGRMTVANMVIEMGAKAGIFEGDPQLQTWLDGHRNNEFYTGDFSFIQPEVDAQYKLRRDLYIR